MRSLRFDHGNAVEKAEVLERDQLSNTAPAVTARRSIARQAAIMFMAAAARELSLLPVTRRGRHSWSSWVSCAALTGLSQMTTRIGLVTARWLGVDEPAPQAADVSVEDSRPAQTAPLTVPVSVTANPTRGRPDRKFAMLKRQGLFSQTTGGARVARAGTLEDLRKAYRLVHEVYLGTGYIHSEPSGMRLRIFETSSETATFIAKVNGKVVGVLSIVGDSPELGLPSDAAFKTELDALRASGAKLCEATNQAVAEEYRKSAVATELMRCAVAHMLVAGYDEAIAAVSPSHNGFYELLGFREIGSQRSYSGKIHDPVVALSMDVNQYRRPADGRDGAGKFIHEFLSSENHFLAYVGEWQKHARRQFLNADLLQQLFVSERNFVAECSAEELRVLHRRWGRELFSAVTGDLFLPPSEAVDQELTCRSAAPAVSSPAAAASSDSLDLIIAPASARSPEPFRSRRFGRVRTLLRKGRGRIAKLRR